MFRPLRLLRPRLSPPPGRAGAFAALVTLALPLAPGAAPRRAPSVEEAHSFPRFVAVALDAPSARAADSIAARLGFGRQIESGSTWKVTASLRRGTIVWYRSDQDREFGAKPTHRPLPLAPLLMPMAPDGLPFGRYERPAMDPMPHPNGARELLGVFAVVQDVDEACETWKKLGATCEPTSGHWIRELGAFSRSARLGKGFIGFMQPARGGDVVPNLLARRGEGWIGFSLRVDDIDSTAAVLDRNRVKYVRGDREHGPGARLWVLPGEAGGVLVGFIQGGTLPGGS